MMDIEAFKNFLLDELELPSDFNVPLDCPITELFDLDSIEALRVLIAVESLGAFAVPDEITPDELSTRDLYHFYMTNNRPEGVTDDG